LFDLFSKSRKNHRITIESKASRRAHGTEFLTSCLPTTLTWSNTSAFVGTNPTGELITSELPVQDRTN